VLLHHRRFFVVRLRAADFFLLLLPAFAFFFELFFAAFFFTDFEAFFFDVLVVPFEPSAAFLASLAFFAFARLSFARLFSLANTWWRGCKDMFQDTA
jgi:hypothetical protein